MENSIKNLYESLKNYLDNRLEYLRLSTVAALANIGANFTLILILSALFTGIVIMLDIYLVLLINSYLQNIQHALIIAAGLNLVFIIIAISILRGFILTRLKNIFTRILMATMNVESEDQDEK